MQLSLINLQVHHGFLCPFHSPENSGKSPLFVVTQVEDGEELTRAVLQETGYHGAISLVPSTDNLNNSTKKQP